MSHDLTLRNRALEELVFDYFRSQAKEAVITFKPGQKHLVEIEMRGTLAMRFESASTRIAGQPDARVLKLLLDPEFAQFARGYEVLSTHGHVVRLIRNELAERSGYNRAVAHFNIEEKYSDLVNLGVRIQYARPGVSCKRIPRRFYAIRYVLRQSAYEKNEDTLLIIVDPVRQLALSADEAARFVSLNLADDSAENRIGGVDVSFPDPKEVRHALEIAEAAAKNRAVESLALRAVKLDEELVQERERVMNHYDSEMVGKSREKQQELGAAREKEVAELETKYRVSSELTLVSLQELQIPVVEYALEFSGISAAAKKKSKNTSLFTYDPLLNTLTTAGCDRCHQELTWHFCSRGGHLECGACQPATECHHPGCGHATCEEHAVKCDHCAKVVCETHEKSCEYCSNDLRYCEQHAPRSYERKVICRTCSHVCAECGQAFPSSHVSSCTVCRKEFCKDDSHACPSCGERYCKDHGKKATKRDKIYCLNCLAPCSSCGKKKIFLKEDLKPCGVCGIALCAEHALACVACGKALCASHALKTEKGPGCSSCFTR